MITDGLTKVNNSEVCVNDDGFGYASEGASRCAPGFYSAKGSRKPCQKCPSGRTTTDSPLQQRLITDCLVKPGQGVVNVALNGSDAFNINVTSLNSTQRANLPVVECPVGTYGPGNSTSAKCVPCPAGSSTTEPGSTSAAACSVCIAGFGKATPNAPCSMCGPSQYQQGGLTACQPCANATFYPPVDGAGERWTAAGLTTFPGAVGPEFCVTKETQLSPEAGQAYFSKDPESPLISSGALTSTSKPSLGACMASCPADSCCLAEFNTASNTCLTGSLEPVGTDFNNDFIKLYIKLAPSAMGSTSSVEGSDASAKMMSSGMYARCKAPGETWMSVGTQLTADARTFADVRNSQNEMWNHVDYVQTEDDCKKKCDASNVCFGFVMLAFNPRYGVECLYKGGEDSLNTRSFFVVPTAVDLSPMNWQGASALDLAVGDMLSIAASVGAELTRQEIVAALNEVFAEVGAYDRILAAMRLGLGS